MSASTEDLQTFQAQRSRLFALAYRLLSSASDAEDAVQDTYLRWDAADHPHIDNPPAWLTRVLTNICLNMLTSARARRERYVGPWLPEPVFTAGATLGPLETAQQRESVSMAMLLLLETLNPAERAVFVLREAFGYGHREIAELLELSEANCQQLYRRAKAHVDERRPRFETSAVERQRIAERFLTAAQSGDLGALEQLLAEDVVSWSDGGGKQKAALRPILGAHKVSRWLHGWMPDVEPQLSVELAEINGQPAVVGRLGDQVYGVLVLTVAEGRVAAVHTVVNPEKLAFLAGQPRP
ncbi:MAG TPA: RNA polymerase sigma-70 factor [Pseudonocardiaceae bacterium]|nr:RNA polymerase sigma-70 factor [Pseudonocardiaceae bacterium]